MGYLHYSSVDSCLLRELELDHGSCLWVSLESDVWSGDIMFALSADHWIYIMGLVIEISRLVCHI